ncbi:MAG: hypothetical protein LBR22_04815 [Desulfovibrio sp.]|nr:hypothetical protein [Desulfovibrio sp.]
MPCRDRPSRGGQVDPSRGSGFRTAKEIEAEKKAARKAARAVNDADSAEPVDAANASVTEGTETPNLKGRKGGRRKACSGNGRNGQVNRRWKIFHIQGRLTPMCLWSPAQTGRALSSRRTGCEAGILDVRIGRQRLVMMHAPRCVHLTGNGGAAYVWDAIAINTTPQQSDENVCS